MKRIVIGAILVATSLFATEYDVLDSRKIVMTTGDVISPKTTATDQDLPSVGTPLFRFDAKQTTGWSFDAVDSSKIKLIPSLIGERSLTLSNAGGDWTSFTLSSPTLVNDPALGDQPCVDFGAIGSKQAMIFNAVDAKNELNGIGSVFMVFNSERGGGALMGGGSSASNGGVANTNNMWLRGLTPKNPSSTWDNYDPYSFLIRYYENGKGGEVGAVETALGRVYHDGFVASPWKVGLNGGWEVVSLQPRSAALVATGVGLGFARAGFGSSSGGQRIAEMIVYGEVLSDENRAKVEAYLEKKWFKRDMRGWNDNAVVDLVRASKNTRESSATNGAKADATVADGACLGVNKLMGGHGGSATFTKNGAGRLNIGDASAYQGAVHANGGTLAFAKRAIPTALPAGDCAHFDAADSSTITYETDEGGLKRVKKWMSKSEFQFSGKTLCLAPNSNDSGKYAGRVPWVREGMLNGKTVLDFGTEILNGTHLLLSVSDSVTTHQKLQGVTTVIAVVSPHSGAPYLVGAFDGQDSASASALSYFNAASYSRAWSSSLFSSTVLNKINPVLSGANDNVMWIDGIRHDHSSGYPQPGWQVVAISGPGSQIGAVGAGAHYYYAGGAMCLAEIVMYARPVSEQEILDASAYLRNKWMGIETPGYDKTSVRGSVPDVQRLSVDAASTLEVAEGTTVRIGTLGGESVLTKTGEGVLEIENEGAAKICLAGGKVKTVAASEPDSFKTPAKDPAAHFDASDANTLITKSVDSRKQVWMWYDKTGRNCAYQSASNTGNQPWLNETDTLNGRPVVDFGPYKDPRYLRLGMPLDGIKAAFVVWGSQNGGGTLLGSIDLPSWENGNVDDFMRSATASISDLILYESEYSRHVWGGELVLNGTKTENDQAYPSGEWDLVEVYPQGAGHASALAYSRSAEIVGGQRLAEVILYERELSEREKVATRNYLMQKWFGKTDAELTPLPAAPAVEPIRLAKVDVAAGQTVTLDEDTDYTISEITGAGTIVKNGAGVLSVAKTGGFSGLLRVDGGKLKLVAKAAPKRAERNLELWLDANKGIVFEDGSDAVITNWISQAPGASFAARAHTYSRNEVTPPTLVPNGINGMPYVDFSRRQYFRFIQNDGEPKDTEVRLTDIKTAFWVIGSQSTHGQQGGGMLFGDSTAAGGGTKTDTFRRAATKDAGNPNGFPGYYPSDPLLSESANADVKAAEWRRNAESVDPLTTGLSGDWDIVSFSMQEGGNASADGLAYVGGSQAGQWASGFQQLGEVLVYNGKLSSTEVCETESYLAMKWGLDIGVIEDSSTNGLKVELAEDVELESLGHSRYIDRLEGPGTVKGEVTLGGLVANADVEVFTVNGMLTIPAGIKVAVEKLNATWTPIVMAAKYTGRENLDSAVFIGNKTSDNLRLRIRNGVLGAEEKQGLVIMVR